MQDKSIIDTQGIERFLSALLLANEPTPVVQLVNYIVVANLLTSRYMYVCVCVCVFSVYFL